MAADWKRISEIVHNFSLGGALVGGLIWTAITFGVLGSKDKAEAELAEARAKISEIEMKIKGNAASNIDIHYEVANETESGTGVIVEVIINNTGTKEIRFDLSGTPLLVYDVIAKEDKVASKDVLTPQFLEHIGYGNNNQSKAFPDLVLLPGVKKTLSFFVMLEKEKVYYVVFQAPAEEGLLAGEEKKVNQADDKLCADNRSESVKKKNMKRLSWFASKYIHVE